MCKATFFVRATGGSNLLISKFVVNFRGTSLLALWDAKIACKHINAYLALLFQTGA